MTVTLCSQMLHDDYAFIQYRVMRMNYAGEEWHSKGVDLHHAFLGSIGGGIAYIGVLCRPDFGFGLTGGIKGNFESLNQPVVWDMKSFMHEVSSPTNFHIN